LKNNFNMGTSGADIINGAGAGKSLYLFSNNDYTAPQFKLDSTGAVWLGTLSGSASAKLDITSTTQGFLPPRMTTTQRDAISTPAAGLIIYNSTTNKHQGYNGTWNDMY